MGGTFTLDTSGVVVSPPGTTFGVHNCLQWSDLSPFVQGYIEAAFESLRTSGNAALSALAELRKAGLDDQRKALADRCHWSRTHNWPGRCDTMRGLGLVTTVAKVDGGNITEPTELGREVLTLLLGFSDLAPSTLAAILKDCEEAIVGYTQPNHAKTCAHLGREFWQDRQRGALCALNRDNTPRFPPVHLSLSDDGKVRMEARS